MASSELEASHSSAGEEEVSSEGSESQSEPENAPPPPPSSRKTLASSNLFSEESDSDSESDAEKADPNIKPLASRPMDDEPLKIPRRKNPTSRYSPPPLKSVAGKRPASERGIKSSEPKKAKKVVIAVAAPNTDGQKNQLFQRLWSEDDEIELIQGMINYVKEKGKDPIADVNDFHEFVRNSLKVDVNNRQMHAKIKRIKAKFMNNVGIIEKKGKVRSFSRPHERKMYELSKKLWGGDSDEHAYVVSCSTKKVNVTPKTNKKQRSHKPAIGGPEVSAIEFPITDEDIIKKGLELLSGPKKVELEEKWKNLKVQELEHFLKKLELMHEQTEIVLDVLKKSGAN